MSRYNEVGGVILGGMENLKIGLLGVGALAFVVAGLVFQDIIAVIGSVLFTCVAALVVYGTRD